MLRIPGARPIKIPSKKEIIGKPPTSKRNNRVTLPSYLRIGIIGLFWRPFPNTTRLKINTVRLIEPCLENSINIQKAGQGWYLLQVD
jgi:hypothetical protein